MFANQLAKIVLIRIGILAPLILGVLSIGVYQASSSWGDLYAILLFGIFGWIMKRMGWPRPPMILGFVLGDLIERNMFVSIQRYEFERLSLPIIIILLALTFIGLVRPTTKRYLERRSRSTRRSVIGFNYSGGLPSTEAVFAILIFELFVATLIVSSGWEFDAKLVPQVVARSGVAFSGFHLVGRSIRFETYAAAGGPPLPDTAAKPPPDIAEQALDVASEPAVNSGDAAVLEDEESTVSVAGLPNRVMFARAA